MQQKHIVDHDHGEQQFKPNTTVAAIIHCNIDGKSQFLLVEELENGRTVYNQPAGHLEANENLINACRREVLEETGLALTPEYVSGIYYFHRPEFALYFLRFCFVIEVETPIQTQPQDKDIIACHWLTLDEIKAKKSQLRSDMVLNCIEDYQLIKSGKKPSIALSTLTSNL